MTTEELRSRMVAAGFTNFWVGDNEEGFDLRLSYEDVDVLADICLIAEWMDTKPDLPTR